MDGWMDGWTERSDTSRQFLQDALGRVAFFGRCTGGCLQFCAMQSGEHPPAAERDDIASLLHRPALDLAERRRCSMVDSGELSAGALS